MCEKNVCVLIEIQWHIFISTRNQIKENQKKKDGKQQQHTHIPTRNTLISVRYQVYCVTICLAENHINFLSQFLKFLCCVVVLPDAVDVTEVLNFLLCCCWL